MHLKTLLSVGQSLEWQTDLNNEKNDRRRQHEHRWQNRSQC